MKDKIMPLYSNKISIEYCKYVYYVTKIIVLFKYIYIYIHIGSVYIFQLKFTISHVKSSPVKIGTLILPRLTSPSTTHSQIKGPITIRFARLN